MRRKLVGNIPASVTALLVLLGTLAGAWFVAHFARAGFDYMGSRGNPRNRAQAHESLRDLIIGAAIVAMALGGGALIIFNTIKF